MNPNVFAEMHFSHGPSKCRWQLQNLLNGPLTRLTGPGKSALGKLEEDSSLHHFIIPKSKFNFKIAQSLSEGMNQSSYDEASLDQVTSIVQSIRRLVCRCSNVTKKVKKTPTVIATVRWDDTVNGRNLAPIAWKHFELAQTQQRLPQNVAQL